MEGKEKHIEHIIARKLKEEASAEDLQTLEDWLKDDIFHKEDHDALLQVWSDSSKLFHQFDTEAGWQKVARQIQVGAVSNRGRVISMFPLQKAIAVAAVFLLTLTVVFLSIDQKSPPEIAWKELKADKNEIIALADGSTIYLRKGSVLNYPDNFGSKERRVNLTGEAFFEIRHDDSKPFVVITSEAVIKDLGTAFLVRDVDSIQEVLVTEGKVHFSSRKDLLKEAILLPGEKGVLMAGHVYKSFSVEKNYLAWRTHKLSFKNAPIQQVVKDLSQYYRIAIEAPTKRGDKIILITAEFEKQTLEKVFEELELTTGLTVKKEGAVYRFSE